MTEMLLTESATVLPENLEAPDDPERRRLVQETLQRALRAAQQREIPAATYRLQFNKSFRFVDAARITPYLHSLGITHAYASPYFLAPPGSGHGYDVINHQAVNPEVGSDDEFDAWITTLHANGMGHILDFVPNHMGVATDANPWWQDVLENGPSSAYAGFFDIDWSPLKPDLANKVLLPVLGGQFGTVLENQELILEFEQGAFYLRYYARRFPITPCSYQRILGQRPDDLPTRLGPDSPHLLEYQSILTAIKNLPSHSTTEPEARQEREREKEVIKRRLQKLCEESPEVAEFIQENVVLLNGTRGEPRSFDNLEQLLLEQPYRLAYWRVASDEINYRRFFDVNELAAVCMEQPEVFAKSHAFVLRLIDEGKLSGLRIDHADGLYDPAAYLRQLQIERLLQLSRREYLALCDEEGAGPLWDEIEPELRSAIANHPEAVSVQPLYVVAEKILEGNERLPANWPIAGTTGYDFVNDVNGLFVDPCNEKRLDAFYRRFSGLHQPFEELVYNAKRLIMKVSMASELNALGHQLDRLSECNRRSHDFTLNGLTIALREVVACFPVYRTYTSGDQVAERDRAYIEQAIARAKRHNPAADHAVFDYIKDVLLLRNLDQLSERERQLCYSFVRRLQQLTGPVMAKSVEDTVFYRYNRFVSLNEVGSDPKRFGLSVATFHQQGRERQLRQPYAMLATSTHDTKRSEDVRARINAISEIPDEWKEKVLHWARWNKRKKTKIDGEVAPTRNDEYLLYQTLVGAWPVDSPPGKEFADRICAYMVKAIREAKMNSSWITPNEAYEKAVCDFVESILCAEPASAFRVDFEPFVERIARAGWWNSLSQTLLKIASPGVPDVYPGTETWSLTLVDPDNRRPVDFDSLERKMAEIDAATDGAGPQRKTWLQELLQNAGDGRIKLFVLAAALRLRRSQPELFTVGEYLPLELLGPQADHVVAFARMHGERAVIVATPRLVSGLTGELGRMPCGEDWRGGKLRLPESLQGRSWRHLYSGVTVTVDEELEVEALLGDFPVGLLIAE